MRKLARIAVGIGLLAASVATAQAQGFYAGKSITIVVGFGPEGGDESALAGTSLGVSRQRLKPQPTYERTAALFARHLGRFLPGRPDITTRAVPGAASLAAVRFLETSAPRDGTVLGVVGPALARLPLWPVPAFRSDPTAFGWIGARTREIYVCVVRGAMGVERLEGLRGRPVFFGATDPRSRPYLHAAGLNLSFGGALKIVPGYGDTEEILLSAARGEVDGMCGVSLSALRARDANWLSAGEWKPVVQYGSEKAPRLAWLPTVSDLAAAADRPVLQILDDEGLLAWPLIAPPGMPPERLTELRAALTAMGSDTEALADATRMGLDLDPVSGEELEAAVKRLARTPAKTLERVRALSGLD